MTTTFRTAARVEHADWLTGGNRRALAAERRAVERFVEPVFRIRDSR
ncbi:MULTISPECIES: hypothetical protein [Rhodococcus]|jgi:hypothetical protein|nr:hypothetical protein [Rhodococcus sp. DK17]